MRVCKIGYNKFCQQTLKCCLTEVLGVMQVLVALEVLAGDSDIGIYKWD